MVATSGAPSLSARSMSAGSIARSEFEPVASGFRRRASSRKPWRGAQAGSRRDLASPAFSARSIGPAGPPVSAMRPSLRLKRGEGDMRLVAILGIEPERGDEAHQIAVAGLVLRQEHDRRARAIPLDATPKGGGRVGEIDRRLRADDRLHAGFRELLREFERAEQVVGVGDRQRRHGVGLGELGERLDRERPLAQRIGAVHVQMHEADGFEDRRIPCAHYWQAARPCVEPGLWMTGVLTHGIHTSRIHVCSSSSVGRRLVPRERPRGEGKSKPEEGKSKPFPSTN